MSCNAFSPLLSFTIQYYLCRKMEDLVHKLIALLKKQPQLQLLHNVCQLLPQNKQEEFDRTAAAALARRKISTLLN